MVTLVRLKMAGILPGLRASTRPRDLQGRVQLLLLALAVVNAIAAMVVVLATGPSPALLFALGLAAPPILVLTWTWVYRHGRYSIAADVAVIAALCVFTMTLDARWNYVAAVVVTSAVFFGSAYGSMSRVLFRTTLVAAVVMGQGLTDAVAMAMACVFVAGYLIVACLMLGMVRAIGRYEKAACREQVLAATGLDLVAASDLASIVAATVEGAYAICSPIAGVRVSLAVAEGPDDQVHSFRVLGAAGRRAGELTATIFAADQLTPLDRKPTDQYTFKIDCDGAFAPAATPATPVETPAAEAAAEAAPVETPAPSYTATLLPGEVLVTRISVAGIVRGVLIVESPGSISDELPAALRALATQASLAVSRTDLQRDTVARESAERFQALIQSSSDVIAIVSPDGIVGYQSPSSRQIFGYDPEAMNGEPIASLVHPDDAEHTVSEFRAVVAEPGSTRMCECRLRHADGSWRHTETRITNLIDVPAVHGIVLNTRDVTERHMLEAELRHHAFHDSLTGLANRVLFTNRVEHALVSSKRDGSTIALLYCDLNGLKRLNDSLGYTAGDSALVMVSERLRACVRGQDIVARMGGNEFAILLDRLNTPADATMAMERIMALLRQPIDLPGAQVELQPHIGIAVSIAGDETADDLLRNGAVAMHQARRYEGGYALFDPEMHADAIRRIEVESQLRTAIDQNQFVMYYQPTIDLRTGRLTGVEALMRWQHPGRGIVPPMEFIPLAEESGLIVPLGQWAIQESCRQVRIWQKEIPADEPIALNVNLSGRQLRHPNIVRDIADALDDSGLLPSRLILEITESVLMIDTAATLNRLFQLKSLGVRLAVDDFGTGYSSFAYLRRFPVDILKIDKSFVDGVATEPTASALVDAMIRIGKTLRLETVAEGVEKIEQADRLRTLQCDIGQGYLFSRPLPSDAITGFLRDRSANGPQQVSDAA
jgi:diguanylate cyclase (GGDEF)-like protein/PAS domain S-box-containing protein